MSVYTFDESLTYGKVFEHKIIEKSKIESYYPFSLNPNEKDKVLGDIFVKNLNDKIIACIDAKRSLFVSIPSIGAFVGKNTVRKHRALYLFETGFMNNSTEFRRYVYDNLCKTFKIDLEKINFDKDFETACILANNYAKNRHNIDLGIFIRMSRSFDLGLCFENIPNEFKISTDNWESDEYWKKLRLFLRY